MKSQGLGIGHTTVVGTVEQESGLGDGVAWRVFKCFSYELLVYPSSLRSVPHHHMQSSHTLPAFTLKLDRCRAVPPRPCQVAWRSSREAVLARDVPRLEIIGPSLHI